MKDLDRFRGCLVGGAAGDALGYAVEFSDEESIFGRYGERGITEYQLAGGVAQISDDTQMTLFTAEGLLLGAAGGDGSAASYRRHIACCYKDWLATQTSAYPLDTCNQQTYTQLIDVPELFARRAPGNTCLSALREGADGTIEEPINNSKGCGGVMRVAPVGLFFAPGWGPDEEIDRIGAEAAAITHGHELGYIPAATLTHIVRRIAHEDAPVKEAVLSALGAAERLFGGAKHLSEYLELMHRAIALAEEGARDLDAIHALGEGWVAEETLAIAVFCALKYPDDIEKALVAAVNHGGNSDSTGAVAGNIVGAKVGLSNIPGKYTEKLELRDLIVKAADDLFEKAQS